MNKLRHRTISAVAIWCALAILPWPHASAATRPVGQAIQFRIGKSLTLSDFGGLTLAYQRSLGRDVAWRVSLGVDLRLDNGELSETHLGDYSLDESVDTTEWRHGISLSSEWLAYRGDQVSVFFGGGPRIEYSSSQSEDCRYYAESQRFWRDKGESYAAGVQGCIGVQWAAADWLTLHAEYSARLMYSYSEVKYWRAEIGDDNWYDSETERIDSFLLDSRGVRFGLSAYF